GAASPGSAAAAGPVGSASSVYPPSPGSTTADPAASASCTRRTSPDGSAVGSQARTVAMTGGLRGDSGRVPARPYHIMNTGAARQVLRRQLNRPDPAADTTLREIPKDFRRSGQYPGVGRPRSGDGPGGGRLAGAGHPG